MKIKIAHEKSRKTYGSPRIHAELSENGHSCSRHRVARLMRQHGIVSKHKRKFRVTTNSAHSYPIAENLLQRQFDVSEARTILGIGYHLYPNSRSLVVSGGNAVISLKGTFLSTSATSAR